MAVNSISIFADDDAGYLGWLSGHPDGYVLNTYRPATWSYVVAHRASCRTISGAPTHGRLWTAGYTKHCAPAFALSELARLYIRAPGRRET